MPGFPIIIAFAIVTQAPTADNKPPDLNCGAYCLYVSLKALGNENLTFDDVEKALGPATPSGYSIGQLAKAAESSGFHTLGVQTSLGALRLRKPPFACIALIRDTHFVNFAEIDDRELSVIDPPRAYGIPVSTLPSVWQGHALLIAPKPLEAEESLGRGTRIIWLASILGLALLMGGGICLFRRRA